MSASRSGSRNCHSKKTADPVLTASKAPWIADDIDYGPAAAAVRDLASWALGIAERDVNDWPEARSRVRRARRFVVAKLAGKARHAPIEDLVFTARLLARIFDADLGLDFGEAIEILAALELPTEEVPIAAVRKMPAPNMGRRFVPPPPLRLCVECGVVHELGYHHHGHRNAA